MLKVDLNICLVLLLYYYNDLQYSGGIAVKDNKKNSRNKLQIRNSTAEFLIFTSQANENTIEVRVEDETVWLTQKLIAELFDKSRNTITEHLQNIFKEGELDENSVCREFRHTWN